MNKLILLLTALFGFFSLDATIVKIDNINSVREETSGPERLVLFNIAEVLIDSEISLGTQAWRKYVRERLDSHLHDALTYYVFKKVPSKPVEEVMPLLIEELQKNDIPVFSFTSRGRTEWYQTQIEGIDILTEAVLHRAGIDFSKTKIPQKLSVLDSQFSNYFHAGNIYTTNEIDKGNLLNQILSSSEFQPIKIILIDDKVKSLESVEKSMKLRNIPFIGYAYDRTSKLHENFDPMIAHIQLDYLISSGKILSDVEAEKIKDSQFQGIDPEEYFRQLVNRFSLLDF